MTSMQKDTVWITEAEEYAVKGVLKIYTMSITQLLKQILKS